MLREFTAFALENWGTIVVGSIVFFGIMLAFRSIFNKKNHSCGGDCSSCKCCR